MAFDAGLTVENACTTGKTWVTKEISLLSSCSGSSLRRTLGVKAGHQQFLSVGTGCCTQARIRY
eukprot:857750-Pelagomonas_calceolata.AAC.3